MRNFRKFYFSSPVTFYPIISNYKLNSNRSYSHIVPHRRPCLAFSRRHVTSKYFCNYKRWGDIYIRTVRRFSMLLFSKLCLHPILCVKTLIDRRFDECCLHRIMHRTAHGVSTKLRAYSLGQPTEHVYIVCTGLFSRVIAIYSWFKLFIIQKQTT